MSLSDALRAAALERARNSGQTIDGVVIEPSGVIDLREMAASASREFNRPVRGSSLSERLASASIQDVEPLTEMALWRRLRPVEPDEATLDLTGVDGAVVDLTDPTPFEALLADDAATPPAAFEPVVIDLADAPERAEVFETNHAAEPTVPPVPTATCGRCGSLGERDLLDVFTRTEYYSCADCGHMWQQPEA